MVFPFPLKENQFLLFIPEIYYTYMEYIKNRNPLNHQPYFLYIY